MAGPVVARLGTLADRNKGVCDAIRDAIALLRAGPASREGLEEIFRLGPLTAIAVSGWRLEVEELSSEAADRHPGAQVGCLYVFGLVSPDEQAAEVNSIG